MVHTCIENREPFVFAAVARKLVRDGASTHTLACIFRPREVDPVIFHLALDGDWTCCGDDIMFKVDTSAPVAMGEGKPEPHRRITLACPRDTATGFIAQALKEHREDTEAIRLGGTGEKALGFLEWNEDAGAWDCVRSCRRRLADTLFLPGDVVQACVDDATSFLAHRHLYDTLHVSPLRVYLFHGTPGGGKTSLVQCVASTMHKNIAHLRFHRGTTDADVREAVTACPSDAVLCIEDVDALFGEHRKAKDHGASFASLLATLDGADTQSPLLVFMTTNRAETLDHAVRRRVDYVVKFGNATKGQCRDMHDAFFPAATARFETLWTALQESVHGRPFPCSVMHKFLVKSLHSGDPLGCVDTFSTLVECVHTPSGEGMFS